MFAAALGWDSGTALEFQAALRMAARTGEARLGEGDQYGQRYVVDSTMRGPRGEAIVRTIWIIRVGEDHPRLVTCHVL